MRLDIFCLKLITVFLFVSVAVAEPVKTILNNSVSWKDETGAEVKLSQWRNSRVVLTMSYTTCQKTCPRVTVAKLKELQKGLDDSGKSAEFIIFSLDPDKDTPEVLSTYKKKMNLDRKNWHFLTGSLADTKALAKDIGFGDFWRMDDHVIHGFKVLVLSPDGSKEAFLDWDNRDVGDILLKIK